MSDPNCIFCQIVSGQAPAEVVYEDERTLAFLDIHPVNTGHTLVIPKAHAQDIYTISLEDAEAVMRSTVLVAQAVKRALKPQGINLLQSNERAAGQAIFHFHMHIIPRWRGDGLITPRHAPGRLKEPLDEVAFQIRSHIRTDQEM